jgi:hypothetical protein
LKHMHKQYSLTEEETCRQSAGERNKIYSYNFHARQNREEWKLIYYIREYLIAQKSNVIFY